jgi:hypothetical protein
MVRPPKDGLPRLAEKNGLVLRGASLPGGGIETAIKVDPGFHEDRREIIGISSGGDQERVKVVLRSIL